MIYECTDCKNCANFDFGFRLFCLCSDLPPEEVCEFHPVGHGDAADCGNFDCDDSIYVSMDDFTECERWCEEKYGDVTYAGVREWCEQRLYGGTK